MPHLRLLRVLPLTLLLLFASAPVLHAGEIPDPPAPSLSRSVSQLWGWLMDRVRPGGFAGAVGFLGHEIDPNGGNADLGHDIDPNGLDGDLGREMDPNG
ncbi:MAG TPA: hypothetical protein VL025_05175 [Thermoanaerobaculia bacterium]|nr:hypothetical protein [Thermoanaerobaculia bacterium]